MGVFRVALRTHYITNKLAYDIIQKEWSQDLGVGNLVWLVKYGMAIYMPIETYLGKGTEILHTFDSRRQRLEQVITRMLE